MSSLKNTPWIATETSWDSNFWIVTDSKCYFISDYIDKTTAKAIAALPETLERLERLEEAAQVVLDKLDRNPVTAECSTQLNNLKKALEV